MSNNPCNGCGGAANVFPFEYPYNRPARDSYGFCTCGDPRKNMCKPSADRCHPGPKPNPNHFPTAGPFIGNGLSLIETYPYLVDTTCLKYGQILSYSESVHTKVTRRNDTSCINLAATFDLTDTNLTNTVLNDFFKKYTAQKYDILEGVLPILKQHLIFKIYYTITDFDGGVLHQSTIRCGSDEMCFHFTDIRDMYVTSSKCLVVENIPAMTYNGMYTFTIDKVEAYMPILDTKHFIQDGLNPFYQFVDNNMRIALQHELIENTPSESMLLIGETPVNASIDYRANVTNRVRLSFTTFMSNVIAARDTVGIWEALNEPTDEIITQLRQEMTTLEETVRLMQNKIDAQDVKIHDLEGQVELNKNNIESHDRKIQHLETLVASYDGTFSALEARIYALEQRPLALVTYVQGKEFKTSQLTWKSYGQLYQCAKAFTASGDFNKDVGLGNLVPIAADATDISAIEAELREVSETANDAASTVNEMSSTVDALSTGVSEIQEQVATLNDTVSTDHDTIETLSGTVDTINGTIASMESDIDTLQDDVADLKEAELSKNKVVVKNLTTGVNQYTNSYGAAATILKADLEGSYKVYPGEGYTQNTITQETFMDVTSLKEIVLPESTTEIGKKAFYNSGITSFNITPNITSMGVDVFGECADLTTVIINAPDLELNSGAFMNCTNLVNLTITAVKKIMTSAFFNTGIATAAVPSTCTFINTGAFGKCLNLTTITIDATDIADHIVSSSSALETINLLSHVSTMNGSAFEGAPSGVTINISKSEDTIAGSPWGATNATINWNAN